MIKENHNTVFQSKISISIMILKSKYLKISCLSILMLFCFLGYSQSCKSSLEVVKNRSYRSLSKIESTFFDLKLINESAKLTTYKLVSENTKTDCSNKSTKSKNSNVLLDIEFVNTLGKPIENNEIQINPNQSVNFKVKVSASNKTLTNRWSCINIKAISDNCNTVSSETMLKAFVSNDSNY